MQWSDVVKAPPERHLRQFAGLFLAVFLGLAGWRWFQGQPDAIAIALATAAVVVGLAGLAVPALVRPIYTGWMMAAFPIGWTVSRLVLGTVFFLIMTPIAWVFRLMGRDLLAMRRPNRDTYWRATRRADGDASYFRQF
jgi:hypothetical protein